MFTNTNMRPDRFNPEDVAPFLRFSTLSKEDPFATLKEEFLHYVWRVKRFNHYHLETTAGEPVHILHAGHYNKNAGPDFLDAQVKIGETVLAGNIEIHLRASEWKKHRHQYDLAYQNVILHVVLVEDEVICHQNGSRIPCLELRNRIPKGLSGTYLRFLNNESWIPCHNHFYKADKAQLTLWMNRLLVERLQRKTAYISTLLEATTNDWEACFYQVLCRSFGAKVNAEPFEWLAQALPLSLLAKHQDRLLHIEALIFGQAGMLERDFEEAYPNKLKREYRHFKHKYDLQPIPVAAWKMLRLRPANFPTIRLAQLAMFVFKSRHLFSKILAVTDVKEIENMFDGKVSDYWLTHYVFDKVSAKRKKSFGKSSIYLFIINTVVPFLFLYGQRRGEQSYQDLAFQLLEDLPPEKNTIIDGWKKMGLQPDSAWQTQALLELKNNFCNQKACLSCTVGHQILRGEAS